MSDSWRTDLKFDNRTGKVLLSTGGGIGGTVIRAYRGALKPQYFKAGETGKMLELLGLPSSTYPDVAETVEYNKSYPIWVSAPSVNARHGGILVGPSGSQSLSGGVSAIPEDDSFNALEVIESLGEGDGSVTSFGKTVGSHIYYNNQSVDVLLNGVAENISATDDSTEVLTGDNGTGTYERSTGVLDYTFNSAPAIGDYVEARYTANVSGIAYFALLSRAPQLDYLGAKITFDSVTKIFTLHLYEKDSIGTYTEKADSPIEFSLTPGAVNGFGKNIHITTVFEDSPYIAPAVNTALTVTTFVDDAVTVDFDGGYRGEIVSGSDLVVGYEEFKKTRTYVVDVFFDVTVDSAIPTKFVELRNSYHKYTRFLCPLAMDNADDTIAAGVPVANRGISFNWNWGLIRNDYNSTGNFWSTLMGEVAVKHADIIIGAFGGLSPAWLDENEMGGQLSSGRVIRMAHDPDEVQLEALDLARVNAIVDDPAFGVMITSRRTSISELSDFSFIDYVGAIDYIIKNINAQVLPYQIVKLNDEAHRNIVTNKTDSIIGPMTVVPVNVIRDYAIQCNAENNSDEVLQREEFKLAVAVKVTPKSRKIVLTFINTPQGSSVEEQFI